MRGAERVVDVQAVAERRERSRELRIVLLFVCMEPQVLQEHDAVRGMDFVDGLSRFVADAVGGKHHGTVEEIGQAIRHRSQAHLRIRLAFRPAQMAGEDDRRAAVEREPDRGQRGADPRVVADALVLQRHVEVDAHEDPLALQIEIADREFHRPRFTSSRRTSTQRFE